jgi:hypothetical protein
MEPPRPEGTRRAGTSRAQPDRKLALIDRACCVSQACLYIFASELRVLGQDLIGGQPVSYQAHDGGHRDAGPGHARHATHDSVVDRYPSKVYLLIVGRTVARRQTCHRFEWRGGTSGLVTGWLPGDSEGRFGGTDPRAQPAPSGCPGAVRIVSNMLSGAIFRVADGRSLLLRDGASR